MSFFVHWGGSGAFVAKNYDATSWHEFLHQFSPFCTKFCKATKRHQMHSNSTRHTKICVWSPMGWIGCVRCEKFRCDFVARTFAPVWPFLHRVSYVNQTIPNSPKFYEMHQNLSLGSNGVDWVRSLRKILTRLLGPNFGINCTSSTHFAPSFV